MADVAKQLPDRELGDRIGLTASAANRVRNGSRRPGWAVMERIAAEFDTDLPTLVAAARASEEGNPDPWVLLMRDLTTLPLD